MEVPKGGSENHEMPRRHMPSPAPFEEQEILAHSEKFAKEKEQREEQELQTEIDDFLNKNFTQNNLPENVALHLNKKVSEARKFNPKYSIYDEEFTRVKLWVDEVGVKNGQNVERTVLDRQKSNFNSLESFVDNLKAQGKPNTEIIKAILKANESGSLKLLDGKAEQYRNFLALTTEPEFAKDKVAIESIVNDESIDISSPEAFENVVYRIYDCASVSTETKRNIEKRFKIKPITNGYDLKEAVFKRDQAVKQQKAQQVEISSQLDSVSAELAQSETKLADLKEQILQEQDFETKRKLEQEYDELEAKHERLLESEKTLKLDLDVLEEQKIPEYIPVQGVQVRRVENDFEISAPSLPKTIRLPDSLNSNEIAKGVNAYLVYHQLQKVGFAGVVFSEDSILNSKMPSNNMMAYSDEILSACDIETAYHILSSEHSVRLSTVLLELRPVEHRKEPFLSNTEVIRQDLESHDLFVSGQFSQERFLRVLSLKAAQMK